jgi:hypothetical protein
MTSSGGTGSFGSGFGVAILIGIFVIIPSIIGAFLIVKKM